MALVVQKIVPSVTGLRFLEALRISFDWAAALIPRPVRFAVVEPKRHHNAPHSRTTACLRSRFGECACQCTGRRDTDNSRQWGKRSFVNGQRTQRSGSADAHSR